jgi:ribosomal protein S18 acetylase RimI-like enzyme
MDLQLAGPENLPEVVALVRAAVRRMQEGGLDQWDEHYPDCEDLRTDIERRELFIYREEGQILASMVLNDRMADVYARDGRWRYAEGQVATLHRLCVHPEAQGRGVAKGLLRWMEERYLAQGIKAVRLDTYLANAPAMRLYEGAGYERAGWTWFRGKGPFCLFEKLLRR